MIKLTYRKEGQDPVTAVYDDDRDWAAICNKVRERMFPGEQLGADLKFEKIMQARKKADSARTRKTR